MKNNFLCTAFLLTLVACSHGKFSSWKGATKEELITAVGEPDEKADAGLFKDAYIYKTADCVTSYTLNWRNKVSEVRQNGECKDNSKFTRSPAKK